MDYSNKAILLDLSRWNTVTDWQVLADNVDGVISKCSEGTDWIDPTFADNCQKAYDHNIAFGAYHYFRSAYYTQFPYPSNDDYSRWPSEENDLQFQNILRAIKHKKIYFLCIDYEEYGNNTAPNWYSVGAHFLHNRVTHYITNNHPEIKLLPPVYTSQGFIGKVPNLNNWIHRFPSWIAQWYWGAGLVQTDWNNLKNLLKDVNAKPALFSTRPTWELWQISGDRFHLPGLKGAVDINLYNGTRKEFLDFIEFKPKPVEPPLVTTPYKAVVRTNIRSTPEIKNNIVGVLNAGEIIQVTETIEAGGYKWAKHSRGWSAVYQIGTRFIEKA
jgi:GH25 family lysozyme M1 (1,4-beta-N-acetylmuramidase)